MERMDTVVSIAQDVLIVIGALCLLFLLIVLWQVMRMVIKIRAVVTQTQTTYKQMTMYVLEPIKYLSHWLTTPRGAEDDDLMDDDESISSSKSTKAKTTKPL